MSSKMGRPKIKNPKTNDLKVRLDDASYEKLLAYCKRHEPITKAEAIRKGIELLLDEDEKT